ncbi:hypothetical protein MRX96_030610 [Rhipicephalus microplus]
MLTTVALVVWTVIILGTTIAIFQLLRWRRRHFSYFKDLGVPGPTPNIFWGNLWEYHHKGITNAIADWCEKYGDVFGFYNGDVPTLVVKDLDFLSYVLVKDFGNFMNRGTTMRTDQQHPFLKQGLLHARDLQWKRTRSVTSHAFTAAKFRQVFPQLDDASDRLLDLLVKAGDGGEKEVAAYELFKPLAMEYISRGSFGIANNFQEATHHPLFRMAVQVLPGTITGPMHMIAQCTTTLQSVMAPLFWLNSKIGSFTYDRFAKLAYQAVDVRRKNPLPDGKKDILQILLDAETEEEKVKDEVTNGQLKVDKKMSSTELSVNTAMLLIAGAPLTTRRWRKGLKYLSCVVDETLRVFPVVVSFTTRSAREGFEYKGVKYSAGLSIMSPTMVVQKDPKAWTEPERFDPDRFLPENVAQQHGMAYQPFGQGPRNCIGKRLALIEIIYTVGRIVERFSLEPGPSQKENLELRFYSMVCEPREGPWIKFKPIPDEEQA